LGGSAKRIETLHIDERAWLLARLKLSRNLHVNARHHVRFARFFIIARIKLHPSLRDFAFLKQQSKNHFARAATIIPHFASQVLDSPNKGFGLLVIESFEAHWPHRRCA
jgi:hypothetical protein